MVNMKNFEVTNDGANSEIDTTNPNWIAMSNALTRAGHGLSLAEKRLIFCGISKLDSRRILKPGEAPVSRVTASEYAAVAQCEPSAAYEAMQLAAKSLYDRSISFFVQAKNRHGKPVGETITHMRWVGRATYKKNEGWVELAWWHEVLPHLFGLRKEFTEYRFSQTTALRSTYSWKLLELLMKFEDTGWAQYTIEDFCTAMEATPKQQENFAKIRTKIIETAVRELTEKDGWVIRWEQIKAGRKVSALRFDFVHNCSDIEVKKITTHKTSTAAQQAKYDYVNIDDAIHAAPVVSNQNTTIEQSEIARAERAKLKVQADEMRSKKKLVPDAVTPSLKVDAFDINDFKDVRNFDKMISLASKIETLSKLDPKRKELEQEFFDELQKGSVLKPSPAKAKALKAAAAKALRATAKKTKPSDSVSD